MKDKLNNAKNPLEIPPYTLKPVKPTPIWEISQKCKCGKTGLESTSSILGATKEEVTFQNKALIPRMH